MLETTLGEACERVDYGLTASSTAERVGPRFLRITDIEGSHVDWSTVPFCAAAPVEQGKYSLANGDIVVARTGASTGRSQWIEVRERAVFASYLVRFRTRPEFDSRYISYVLQSPDWLRYVDSQAHGKSAQPNMSAASMAAFTFRHPVLAIQRATAEVLGALDDKIAANTALAATSWTLMEAGFRAIQADPHIERRTLGAIVSLEYGKALPTNVREPGDVSVVGSGGVNGVHSKALVHHSGVVVGRKGSAGSVHWVSGPHFPIDTTFYARGTDEAVSQPYLYFLLRTLRLDEMNNDSAVPGLNRSEALALPISLPPATRLARFTSHAERLIELVEAIDRENRTLAATRDALLPRLMSGKLRVRDAEAAASEAGL